MSNAAANAARQKAAKKHEILRYIQDHYAMTKQGLCGRDIMAKLHASRDTVHRSLRDLVDARLIHCIGLVGDTDREDLPSVTRIFAPIDAERLPRRIVKARVPRAEYVSKPEPLRERRAKGEKYRGEIAKPYVRPWPVSGEDTGRKPSDFWLARDLALIGR